MPPPSPPRLTVVLLTWNEERNIASCLQALAAQRDQGFEVVVIDAASTDRTVEEAQLAAKDFPVPFRLEVAERRISVGEARNRGVAMAKAPIVAFLSADAEPDERWTAEALHSLRSADLVFGRQLHDPPRLTAGAAVRGLRYHFPDGPTTHPARFASNVSAAIRREVLLNFPFGTTPGASAVDDLLLVRRALEAGYHAAYNPAMVVRHHDVDGARAELRKNLREGLGWGEHVRELGLHTPILGWGLALAFVLLLFSLAPGLETLLVLAGVLWLPALRRARRRWRRMPLAAMALGVAASPPFDVAFLLSYLKALALGRGQGRAAAGNKVNA